MDFDLREPTVISVNDHTWLLNDHDEATGYVIAGTERAAVIDTMIGLVDVHSEARKLTNLPLILINTHGHSDHIGGNWGFERAYMNLLDIPVAENALSHPLYQKAIDHFGFRYPDYSPIEDGQVFDLGGLELTAYHFPGHTPGEIVLLDKEDRILFSGDGVIEQLWLQTPESLPIASQIDSMMKIRAYRDDFDTILSGHSRKPEDATLFDSLLNGLIDLKNGNTKTDVDYEWWGGVAKAHQYGSGPRRIIYPAN